MRRTCMWQADAQDVEDAARWTGGAPLLLRLVGGLLCCCHNAQAALHATASQAAGAQADRAADSAAGGRLRRLLSEPATPERFACIGSHQSLENISKIKLRDNNPKNLMRSLSMEDCATCSLSRHRCGLVTTNPCIAVHSL